MPLSEIKNILVVGGAGYIGSHVNKLLHENGYRTVVFDNLSRGHRDLVKWGEFVLGDLGDSSQLRLCFQRHAIDAVMHFAAFAYVGESVEEPAKYYRNNVAHTINLLETMSEFGVKKLVFSSTCSTYGIPDEVPIDEGHPQRPINPYGAGKLMIERMLQDWDHAYGLKHVALRYFNAAGADPNAEIGERHDPETHLIPLAISTALGSRAAIKVFGTDYPTPDGTCVRDYVHVSDLADAHVAALRYLGDGGSSDAFNLGNERGYSVLEVIDAVRRAAGTDVDMTLADRRPGDPPSLVSSSAKARDTLQWRPRFPGIDAIVESAWRWHESEANDD